MEGVEGELDGWDRKATSLIVSFEQEGEARKNLASE